MPKARTFSGVIAPLVTPFGEDGAPDPERFVAHADWLMANGCSGLAPFGTTSEANSLGLDERMEMLEELVDSGLDAAKLLPGTGMCSVTDAVTLTQHAVDVGCGGCLMLPPFYYKNPSEDGLFAYYSEVIEAVGDDRLKVYLYHIPPMATGRHPRLARGTAEEALSRHHRRPQGFVGRLGADQGLSRRVPGSRNLPRLRGLSARRPARRWRRYHLGLGQRQCSGADGRLPRPTRRNRAMPTRCRRRSAASARCSSRSR